MSAEIVRADVLVIGGGAAGMAALAVSSGFALDRGLRYRYRSLGGSSTKHDRQWIER